MLRPQAALAAAIPALENPHVKVRVKTDMCEGHGKCEKAAPELFKVGDDDVSIVLIEGDIPKELEEKAERAYRLCPRQAIELLP